MIAKAASRRGFTLIELLIVMLVIGVLATIVVPRVQQYRSRAEAASLLTSMKKLEFGIMAASDSTGLMPPAQAGSITDSYLARHLPSNFALTTARYSMIWVPDAARQSGSIMLILLDGTLCAPIYAAFGSTQSASGQITVASCSPTGGTGLIFMAVR